MAYQKHTWTDNELITKEKLNNIENGIANIELTPGPAGPQGPRGEQGPAGPQGSVQDATLEVKGVVKMASAAGTISTANVSTAISGTQADDTLNAMRNLTNETKNKLNEVITKLKNAGIMEN